MKKEIRILGIDDMPFSFDDEVVDVIGVVMRGNHYIEGVLRTTIEVDGMNSTPSLTKLINNTRHSKQLKVVMVDGGALGGFNVVDIEKINEGTGVPIMTVTRNEPDEEKIKEALKKHFDDWEERWKILNKGEIKKLELNYPLYVKYSGIQPGEVREVVRLSIVRGAIPEPIRIAHLIATGIKTGESYGKNR
ncbi:MAG: DUF99 family protein [Candidatus Thermoplasmatota archaeon]|nr:DUF99 family protein [Candidatus Thermoplasmatota archaeon]